LDPVIPPLPWKYDVYRATKPLKIGYCLNDNFFQISRSCARAVEEVVNSLRRRGHELVEFKLPRVDYAVGLYFDLMTGDELQTLKRALSREEVDPTLSKLVSLLKLPRFLQKMSLHFLRLIGQARESDITLRMLGPKSVLHVWRNQYLADEYRREFLNQMSTFDVLIVPGSAVPAITHNTGQSALPLLYYSYIFNLLNFPAGTVPVTRVTPDDTKILRQVRDPWDKLANEWDKGSEGLPVGVQVVGPPWQDEKVLRVMKEIELEFPFTETIFKTIREIILNSK